MHVWKTNARPTPSDYHQLHVDDNMQVWEWNHQHTVTKARWEPRPGCYLKKVRESTFYLRNNSNVVGSRPSLRKVSPGQLKNEWDLFYSKAFFEITHPWREGHWYFTNATWAELEAWLLENTPEDPDDEFKYGANPIIHVYEVFEPGDSKLIAYNSMYSSARGGGSYNRRRFRLPGYVHCGTDYDFSPDTAADPYWGGGTMINVGHEIMLNTFTDINVVTNPNAYKAMWFSGHDIYKQPNVGNATDGPVYMKPTTERWAYNSVSQTYVQVPANITFEITEKQYDHTLFLGMTATQPNTRSIRLPSTLKGTSLFSKKLQGIMTYPVSCVASNLYAVLMKPLGVDTLGIGLRMDDGLNWKIVAEYVYNGERETSHKFVSRLASPDGDWDQWDLCHKVNFHTGVGFPDLPKKGGIDEPRIPKHIEFYALHTPTGRRTETFSRRLKVVKRQNNITMCLVPELTR